MTIDEISMKTASEPEQPEVLQESVQPSAGGGIGFQIPEFLKAKTGAGSVESYIDHPMNLGKNEHFARILRGLTGMFDALDYAIIDVVIGGFQFLKKPKAL